MGLRRPNRQHNDMQQLYLFKLQPAPKARYGGHEGYLPKKHWLKRAVTAAVRDPQFWCRPAPGVWGFTPPMLKAVKHWAIAFKLLEPQGKNEYYNVSEFARKLLLDDGADPYLEDPQSEWLLHWNLLREPCYLKTWQWFFSQFYALEFDPDYALRQYVEFVRGTEDTIAEATLAADLKTLYKLYLPTLEPRLEDQLTALFTDLTLLRTLTVGDKPHAQTEIRKQVGLKAGLSHEVLLYGCLQYAQQRHGTDSRSIALKTLLYEPHSPGLVFLVSQSQLEAVLDSLCRQFTWLHLSASADLYNLSWDLKLTECLQQVWSRLHRLELTSTREN